MVSEIVHIELHGLRPEAHCSSSMNQNRVNIIQVQLNSCSFSSEIICYLLAVGNQLYCESIFNISFPCAF